MNDYNIIDILAWSSSGFFAGKCIASIMIGLTCKNTTSINKIAMGYGIAGLIVGGVRGFTGKSIIELITNA